MDQRVLDYIQTQRICVLAVEMMDGSPHAATVHFAHTNAPFMLFFETDKNYRKSEPLFGREKTRASVVVGSDEKNMQTLQMDGEARLIREDESDLYEQVYHGKFPEKGEKAKKDTYVRFVFIPTWWRFTDWTGSEGKLLLTSTDNS